MIASSFGDIHSNNCFKVGVLPVVLSQAECVAIRKQLHENVGATISIDLAAQTLTDVEGELHRFDIHSIRKKCMLEGLDDIGRMEQYRDAFDAFESKPQIQSGEIKVLAMANDRRSPFFPDVPSLREAGYEVIGQQWRGIWAPKETPDEVVSKAAAIFEKAVKEPGFQKFGPEYYRPHRRRSNGPCLLAGDAGRRHSTLSGYRGTDLYLAASQEEQGCGRCSVAN